MCYDENVIEFYMNAFLTESRFFGLGCGPGGPNSVKRCVRQTVM